MQFVVFENAKGPGLGLVLNPKEIRGFNIGDDKYPGDLQSLIEAGPSALNAAAEILRDGPELDVGALDYLPPIPNPSKIICIGLNYVDHTSETGFEQPDYPTVFSRFASTLIGHERNLIKPKQSEQFDYEGEIAAIIGKTCFKATAETALDHIIGYSIFNDVSVRDYQFKSPQWTMGKNFDGTGVFGPAFVTAESLPPGIKGLKIETRLNGEVVQSASTDDLVFDVATLIVLLSDVMTLNPGDVVVTGTPAGVGMARNPHLWMKHGDRIEVQVEQLGTLRNNVVELG